MTVNNHVQTVLVGGPRHCVQGSFDRPRELHSRGSINWTVSNRIMILWSSDEV